VLLVYIPAKFEDDLCTGKGRDLKRGSLNVLGDVEDGTTATLTRVLYKEYRKESNQGRQRQRLFGRNESTRDSVSQSGRR
jgi:hypothetical protein